MAEQEQKSASGFNIFGFEIKRKKSEDDKNIKALVPKVDEDGPAICDRCWFTFWSIR